MRVSGGWGWVGWARAEDGVTRLTSSAIENKGEWGRKKRERERFGGFRSCGQTEEKRGKRKGGDEEEEGLATLPRP